MKIVLYILLLTTIVPLANAQQSSESYKVKSKMQPTVYVVGKVNKPAEISFDGSILLFEAIRQAEGTILPEKKNKAVVRRRPTGCQLETVIIVDLENFSINKESDIFLQPLDIIEVQPKKLKYKPNNSPRPCHQEKSNNKSINSGIIFGL